MLKFHNKLIQYGFVYYHCSQFTGKPEYRYGTYNIPHIDTTASRFILDVRGIYDVMYRLPHKPVKNFKEVKKNTLNL